MSVRGRNQIEQGKDRQSSKYNDSNIPSHLRPVRLVHRKAPPVPVLRRDLPIHYETATLLLPVVRHYSINNDYRRGLTGHQGIAAQEHAQELPGTTGSIDGRVVVRHENIESV